MSQSATLYRISQDLFKKLKTNRNLAFEISTAKSYSTFESSFIGLEYVIAKGQNAATIELLKEIFEPNQALGLEELKGSTAEEQFALYESGCFIPYLDSNSISEIDKLLDTISEDTVHLNYDSKELNSNGIYPRVWHDNNSPELVINKRQLIEDLAELKIIFKDAANAGDYILVFVG
jgi:hypothetical protein